MDNGISVPDEDLIHSRTSIPAFWEMKTALMRVNTVKGLSEFYAQVLSAGHKSQSQLFQDIFVDFIFEKQEKGTFLEFGATDGFELSNSCMLEKERGWRGVLAEPDPQWHKALLRNRPDAKVVLKSIYSKSGEKMRFISSAIGVLSSLKKYASVDANSRDRLKDFQEIDVDTISLNDVFESYFNGKSIDYMSVDTEGSEFDILSSFDFVKYHPSVITVEHNYSDNQVKLDNLLTHNGYYRVFRDLTNFDAWYVLYDLANYRKLI